MLYEVITIAAPRSAKPAPAATPHASALGKPNALPTAQSVAEVASVGGYEKEYQVNVDPNKLV